jgi:hypothetical protein
MPDEPGPSTTYAELLALLPPALTPVLPTVPWRLDLLRALDLPVEPVPVEDLAWLFDLPLWPLDGEAFRLTPREVAEQPMRHADEYQRVMDADLNDPIHLVQHRTRLVVLDGFHRLLKAHFLRRHWIDAKILAPAHLGAICT